MQSDNDLAVLRAVTFRGDAWIKRLVGYRRYEIIPDPGFLRTDVSALVRALSADQYAISGGELVIVAGPMKVDLFYEDVTDRLPKRVWLRCQTCDWESRHCLWVLRRRLMEDAHRHFCPDDSTSSLTMDP